MSSSVTKATEMIILFLLGNQMFPSLLLLTSAKNVTVVSAQDIKS
jgi:hypothetical protein